LEEDQLIELNLFGMITSEAFTDATGQIEIYLPVGSNEATGIYDYYTSASERLKAREYEASEEYVPN
ncbi:hypothetical protein, partial [Escherichia coli]|uniref:hypothetical protein n=1 Tax=Escherichia coli TaxID=562 RepID=UPI003EDF7A91